MGKQKHDERREREERRERKEWGERRQVNNGTMERSKRREGATRTNLRN